MQNATTTPNALKVQAIETKSGAVFVQERGAHTLSHLIEDIETGAHNLPASAYYRTTRVYFDRHDIGTCAVMVQIEFAGEATPEIVAKAVSACANYAFHAGLFVERVQNWGNWHDLRGLRVHLVQSPF
tara:strand:- start:43 stop:426 length:384 start_codon:yes stop_codon:yes gene_type:complete